jgi:hypothetical protein
VTGHGSRVVTAALGALVALAMAGCGDDSSPVASEASSSTSTSVPQTSGTAVPKVPASISDLAARVEAARKGGLSDLSSLSTAFLHVRADGKIELVLRSLGPIAAGQEAELAALGVETAGTLEPNALQVWVPAEKADAVGALAWVASVTPPSYSRVGG